MILLLYFFLDKKVPKNQGCLKKAEINFRCAIRKQTRSGENRNSNSVFLFTLAQIISSRFF